MRQDIPPEPLRLDSASAIERETPSSKKVFQVHCVL
jgi:hypothetical protein